MLYNVIISPNNLGDETNWILNDGYIRNELFSHMVRIDTHLIPSFTISKISDDQIADAHVEAYGIPNCRYICNNRTMNGTLMTSRRASDESDNIIIFVAVHSSYKMNYTIRKGVKVLYAKRVVSEEDNTYYNMCTIVCSRRVFMNNNKLIARLNIMKDDVLHTYSLTYDHDTVETEVERVTNEEFKKKFYELEKNKRHHSDGFRFIMTPHKMITCALICRDDSKTEMEMEDASHTLKNRVVIKIPNDALESPDKMYEIIHSHLACESNIRAVTTFNVQIPRDVIHKLRILYVFRWNPNTSTVEECVR